MKHTVLKRRLLAFVVSGLFLGAVLLIYGFNYSINDDTAMVSILNGSYSGTPDGHAMFVKYPLTWVIKTLYQLTTAVPWYPVVLMLLYWLAMGFLLCQLLSRFPAHSFLVCALFVGGMSLLWIGQIVRFTYTTCGAFVSSTVSFSYALMPKEEERKPDKLIPLLVLFSLSYCIRDYFALVSLLFCALVWLSRYYDRMFRELRCWLVPAAALCGLALCVLCNTLAYSSPEWQDFLTYNDERSYIQDYTGIPSYDDNRALYDSLGYSSRERKCISSYSYVLLEDFGPETFHELYEYVKDHETTPNLTKSLKKALKNTVKHYLLFDKEELRPLQALSLAAPAALLLISLYLSLRDKRHYWVFPLLILIGLGCMWYYITYAGRYPTRVALSLRIITILSSLTGFAVLLTRRPIHPRWLSGKAGQKLLLALALVATVGGGALTWAEVGHHTAEARAFSYAYADAHPDAIFLRDTNLSYTVMEDSPSFNTVSTGGWLHYSPLYEQKLDQLGLEEIHRSTLLQPNVYLITSSKRNIYKLLGLEKDTPLVYEVVAEQDGVSIYQFFSIG